MRRRSRIGRVVCGLACAVAFLAGAQAVHGQSPAVATTAPPPRAAPYRIGIITYAGGDAGGPVKEELAKLGYREGENVVYRQWSGNRDRAIMPELARELVAWKPDVILSMMTNAHVAVRDATRNTQTPVVLWSADPLETGVIESFRRPGTNFTGFTYEPYQAILHLRLLKWALPELTCVGHLYNHTYAPAPSTLRDLRLAAAMMNLKVVVGEALTKEEIEPRIASFRAAGCQAFTVGPHELFNGNGQMIGELALRHGLAAVSIQGSIVNGGGLAAYTPPHDRGWPVMAAMVDRILRGEKPANIPVERRLGSPLVINLKAARALGLTLPAGLLDEADRIIE